MDLLPVLKDYGWLAVIAFFLLDKAWPVAVTASKSFFDQKRKVDTLQVEHQFSLDERYFNLLVSITSDLRSAVSQLGTQLEHVETSMRSDYHTSLSNVNATLLSLQTDIRGVIVYLRNRATN